MDHSGKDWQRLADLGIRRREDQDWTQVDVATRGALSLDSVQALESARRTEYRPRTLRCYEDGLLWARGSIKTVLGGGDPIPLEGGPIQGDGEGRAQLADEGETTERQAYEMLRSVLGVFGRSAFESALGRLRTELGEKDSARHTERGSSDHRVG